MLSQILFVFKTKIWPKPGQAARFKIEVIHIFMHEAAKLMGFSVDSFKQRILPHTYIHSKHQLKTELGAHFNSALVIAFTIYYIVKKLICLRWPTNSEFFGNITGNSQEYPFKTGSCFWIRVLFLCIKQSSLFL